MKELISDLFSERHMRRLYKRLIQRFIVATIIVLTTCVLHVLASINHWESVLVGTQTSFVLISAAMSVICYQRFAKMRSKKDLYVIRQYRNTAYFMLGLSILGMFVSALNLFGFDAVLGSR
ncbi:hypothetical protein J2T17_006396 [Paenibacillus mucilaginosus]